MSWLPLRREAVHREEAVRAGEAVPTETGWSLHKKQRLPLGRSDKAGWELSVAMLLMATR